MAEELTDEQKRQALLKYQTMAKQITANNAKAKAKREAAKNEAEAEAPKDEPSV